MKKSELKEIIKSSFLSERPNDYNEDKYDEGLEDVEETMRDKDDDMDEGMRGKYEEDDTMREAEEVDVEDNEDIDVNIEDEVDIDDETSKSEIEVDSELAGEDSDVAAILGLLTKAQSEAKALGDEKLMDQIGNTITYYTRQHVVAEEEGMDPERFQGSGGDEVDSDSNINISTDNPAEDAGIGFALDESTNRFAKLAGLIK